MAIFLFKANTNSKGINLDMSHYPCYHIIMIQFFNDAGTEDIFNGKNTKQARKLLPVPLWKTATRNLDQVDSAIALSELRIPPDNQLKALSGDRKGQYSIRINDQFRICFIWSDLGPEQVEIVKYH
jgi:toxin HigB-1